MAPEDTSAIREPSLTQPVPPTNSNTPANQPQALHKPEQHASSEVANSVSLTDPGSMEESEELDEVLDLEQRQIILAALRRDAEYFRSTDAIKAQVRQSYGFADNTPTFTQPGFPSSKAYQAVPEENIHKSIEATVEESPQQSIHSDHSSARLIKATSSQDDKLRSTLPSHFPQFRHVRNHGELGKYIDRSQYAISIGSGPLDDLQYGIIIVPFGEEHMLFRAEDVSRETPFAAQQEPSLQSVNEVQNDTGAVFSVVAPDSLVVPAALSEGRTTPKRKRISTDRSLRSTKSTKTRLLQNPAPIRSSPHLSADLHIT